MIPGVIGALYGMIAAWAFRRLTDPVRLRQIFNRLLAHTIEFRLFVDEPALIWRAQWGALRANLALLREIALPTLGMAVVFAILWGPMDRKFGHDSLRAGEATVITSRADRVPAIPGMVVETPGVRVMRTGEVSWRVRPVREFAGSLPAGYEARYPLSRAWLVWFFAGSLAAAPVATIKRRSSTNRANSASLSPSGRRSR